MISGRYIYEDIPRSWFLWYPDAPCMEYLPTFTPKITQLCKYIIHEASGVDYLEFTEFINQLVERSELNLTW